jgi:formiminoglutamase
MDISVKVGHSPLLLAQPHGGIEVPPEILSRLNDRGRELADTDWHIPHLYDGLLDDVTVVGTPVHRYVIDANRNPSDQSLYPGQNTTSLCPTTDFQGAPIYREGEEPDPEEIRQRQQQYHQPYHDALGEQLARLHQAHGYVVLYDCHSIRSQIPFLFDGVLPDFNIGTNSDLSCDPAITTRVTGVCAREQAFTHVVNGRFKGGWTTRHYGDPAAGYHAIQMELAQCLYMEEQAPWLYDVGKADRLREILSRILAAIIP